MFIEPSTLHAHVLRETNRQIHNMFGEGKPFFPITVCVSLLLELDVTSVFIEVLPH